MIATKFEFTKVCFLNHNSHNRSSDRYRIESSSVSTSPSLAYWYVNRLVLPLQQFVEAAYGVTS